VTARHVIGGGLGSPGPLCFSYVLSELAAGTRQIALFVFTTWSWVSRANTSSHLLRRLAVGRLSVP
jgi:hypothetical protein